MSWNKDSNGKFVKPTRPPDYSYKDTRCWFKEMIVYKGGIVSPIMECPVSYQIMVYREPNGWYAMVDEIRRQYEIYITDKILLGDGEENETSNTDVN